MYKKSTPWTTRKNTITPTIHDIPPHEPTRKTAQFLGLGVPNIAPKTIKKEQKTTCCIL